MLRLGVWLGSLGDKAPEVLSTLMDLLAKGVIKPHNGMLLCTLVSTVVRHTLLTADSNTLKDVSAARRMPRVT